MFSDGSWYLQSVECCLCIREPVFITAIVICLTASGVLLPRRTVCGCGTCRGTSRR